MFQCFVVHFLSSGFLKLLESKRIFLYHVKNITQTFQMSKRKIRTFFRIHGHCMEWFIFALTLQSSKYVFMQLANLAYG